MCNGVILMWGQHLRSPSLQVSKTWWATPPGTQQWVHPSGEPGGAREMSQMEVQKQPTKKQ